MTVPVPAGLVERLRRRGPGSTDVDTWVAALPRVVRELADEWDLRLTGVPTHGDASLVLPVESPNGPAVLKVAWPRPESRDAHRVLTAWVGRGAVRLLAADPSRGALLLERLDPRDLGAPGVRVLDACEEIGRLASVLDRPAPPWVAHRAGEQLRRLAADIDAMRAAGLDRGLPRRLLDRGRSVALELASEPEVDARLVHADLRPGHVLWRPDPGEWVAIGPHAIAADPAWVVAPVLMSRWAEAVSAHDTRVHLNVRLDVVCEAAGLDPDRARLVSEVRVLRAAVGDVQAQPADLAAARTRHVALLKALQPA